MDLFNDFVSSPIGEIHLIWCEDRLRALQFADCEERLLRTLAWQFGEYTLREKRAPKKIRNPLAHYFQGDLRAIDTIPVEMRGTPLQQRIWAALRAIPPGRTRSYGELAAQLGRPRAGRAIGAANGANPISIVIPCHRLIGAGGALIKYGGGLERKRWLLKHEEEYS
jgi:methylated-DNA-[protein]-cysteine S-methyltransferase